MALEGFDNPLVSIFTDPQTGRTYFCGWQSYRDMAKSFRTRVPPRVRGFAADEATAEREARKQLDAEFNAQRCTCEPARVVLRAFEDVK